MTTDETVNVLIYFSDGHYWMELAREGLDDADRISIPVSVWRAYQAFRVEERKWHMMLLERDNALLEQKSGVQS